MGIASGALRKTNKIIGVSGLRPARIINRQICPCVGNISPWVKYPKGGNA